MIRKSKSASTKWKENPFIHSLQIITDTSHYFFQNFSSFLHIVSFETNLGTSEGIFREMWTSLSCLRSKTDYRFKTWGTSQRGPASVTVYLCKKGEARWRKRTGNRCRLALLLSKSETNSFKYTLFYSSHNWQIDASIILLPLLLYSGVAGDAMGCLSSLSFGESKGTVDKSRWECE